MNILIVHDKIIPVAGYGGTERMIWYLGKTLNKMGHKVTYLVPKGSSCPFAKVIYYNKEKNTREQIPEDIDVIHFNSLQYASQIDKPHIFTMHGNRNDQNALDKNTVFVSRNHALRFGSESFVYNGLDWDDYGKVSFNNIRTYFHFLGDAAWRVKNVQGAIDVVLQTKPKYEKLKILGGTRLNFRMGLRVTLSPRISFHKTVVGEKKNYLLANSKGLIFPVRWHEPFGLAITESLYFGCPIFGTPYGSLCEIVAPDVGYLSNNKNDLSNAILYSNDFDKKKCHEYAVEYFNAQRMAQHYIEKYEKVLNGEFLNQQEPRLVKEQKEKYLTWN